MRVIGEKETEDKQLNTLIPPSLDKELKVYCALNGKKQKEVVEMALKRFLSVKPQEKANIEN